MSDLCQRCGAPKSTHVPAPNGVLFCAGSMRDEYAPVEELKEQPVAKIDIGEHQCPDGTFFVMLKVQAANGMLEVGLLLNPEHAKATANALATKAKQCQEKIVIPRPQIARA